MLLAGRNKNWSQKSESSRDDVDQSAAVTYVEINSPGLQGGFIFLTSSVFVQSEFLNNRESLIYHRKVYFKFLVLFF